MLPPAAAVFWAGPERREMVVSTATLERTAADAPWGAAVELLERPHRRVVAVESHGVL